jgi:enoyl-[acyl-carrier protein] reductase II
VARGFVGPARWLKTPSSKEHQRNTLLKAPSVYLDTPDDLTTVPADLLISEREAIDAVCTGEREKALMAGGECAQRVKDLPAVQDLVDGIIDGATNIVRELPQFAADS